MAQQVRTVENLPEEAAELAEAASRLIEAEPGSRRALADLAALLGGGPAAIVGVRAVGGAELAAVPAILAAVLARLLERLTERRSSVVLPRAEQELWEDAGASFATGAIETNAINAAAAYADLVIRSLEGDIAVAARLGVDRSRISQRVRDKSLYAFSHGDTRFFPAWQFVGDGTLPGLRDVLSALDDRLHPLVVDHWFTTPSLDLEIGETPVSPITWLDTGGSPRAVVELAADL